jgi:hypothetical protein
VSCGLYALSPRVTVYGKCNSACSAVYAHLDSGRIVEETFYPYSKYEIRKVHTHFQTNSTLMVGQMDLD